MSSAKLAIAALALGGVLAPALQAEEPAQLLDRVEKLLAAANSWEMDMTMTTKSDMIESKSTTKSWYQKTGDTYKQRIEAETTMTMQGMPPQSSQTLVVSDGKHVWMQSSQAGQTMVMKQNQNQDPTGMQAVREHVAQGKATVKPSETLDGESHAVLEVVSEMGGDSMKTTYWFNEKTGMMTKQEGQHPVAGHTVMHTTNVKMNPSIPADKFTYTPPDGVQVLDQTTGS